MHCLRNKCFKWILKNQVIKGKADKLTTYFFKAVMPQNILNQVKIEVTEHMSWTRDKYPEYLKDVLLNKALHIWRTMRNLPWLQHTVACVCARACPNICMLCSTLLHKEFFWLRKPFPCFLLGVGRDFRETSLSFLDASLVRFTSLWDKF